MSENSVKDEMSVLEKKICQQIEYYFGDHNLPRDKFLKEQIKLDDGWVPLETMIKFNRLSQLTTDLGVIVEALCKSKTGLLEIHEDKSKIRRSPNKPLPEITDQYRNSIKNRSVYVKGFPTDASLDDIKEWFEDKGTVENIQMRRNIQKEFKGSIFAVFDSDDSAKKFTELPQLKYKDTEMIILFKDAYFTKKYEERKLNRAEAKAKAKHDRNNVQKQAEVTELKSLDEKKECLLKFSGDLDDQTCREDFYEIFEDHGEIKWIDFIRGAKEGIILFKEKAQVVLEKAKEAHDGNVKVRNKDVTWQVIEGEEEKAALKKIMEDQQESLNKRKFKVRRFKGKGKGGKGAGGRGQGKVQFQGKKTTFGSDEEEADERESEPPSSKKRIVEETGTEQPAAKQQKTENGAGDDK
ncbi:lupus La protein isoform X2 [Latimeria chalumnae]|uniref:lupus La protein isoform X2 n=1 Tax=Latimeria chalumnae TaxID=7897 RepID=UPI00313C4DF8